VEVIEEEPGPGPPTEKTKEGKHFEDFCFYEYLSLKKKESIKGLTLSNQVGTKAQTKMLR